MILCCLGLTILAVNFTRFGQWLYSVSPNQPYNEPSNSSCNDVIGNFFHSLAFGVQIKLILSYWAITLLKLDL